MYSSHWHGTLPISFDMSVGSRIAFGMSVGVHIGFDMSVGLRIGFEHHGCWFRVGGRGSCTMDSHW